MSRLALAVLVLCAAPLPAFAWTRPTYEDAEVVGRSELVVVAHLKPGSIQRVEHVKAPSDGASWEHHATLVITQTLQGTSEAAEIPIIIHYGLDPLVEGKLTSPHERINFGGSWPRGSVQIVDTGNSAVGGPPLLADATTDNLWFLRRRAGIYGREPGHGDLGIVDPEDLRPLADKDYILLYLGADPEGAVRTYAATHANAGAARYVDHVDIQHVLALKDPGERVDKLLPYFLRHAWYGLKDEAGDGIVAAGADVAGPRLLAVFAKADHGTREGIMSMWGRLAFKGATDTLVALLVADDKYWASQKLTGDWWNTAIDSPVTRERRDRYGEVYEAVIALGTIKDRRAKAALEATLARWKAIKFDNPQIVEACEAALASL